jgi:hypothetical protein
MKGNPSSIARARHLRIGHISLEYVERDPQWLLLVLNVNTT